jgi:GWxTD domain-containing protein
MFQMRFRVAPLAALALAAGALTALAQEKLNKADKNWMEKEVGAIITAQEKATFQEINKDDRKLFKDLFWMRRDFNPMTSENEFQKNFAARIKAADENFKGRAQKGSESDPGQIFLLLGPPSRQERGSRESSGGGATDSPASQTAGADPGTGEEPGGASPGLSDFGGGGGGSQFLTWIYDPNPDLGIPNGLTVQFRQQNEFGYRLVASDELSKQLERVKERLVSNPSVNYDRDTNGRLRKADARFDPNSPAKLALKALRETGTTSDAIQFDVTPAFFRASAGQIYIPLDFVIGSGLDASEATMFGAVDNADGITVYQFEEKSSVQKDASGKLTWEMPLQLQPGLYTLYAGIMNDASSVHGSKVVDLDVPDLSSGELTISSVLMFSEGKQVGEAMGSPGKAFLLGGYHFTPKRDMVYTQQDQLAGVFYAYNYGIAGDKPNLTYQVTFFKESERRGATKEEGFMLQTAEMALTIFDISLNLPNFKDPGSYKIAVKVTDHTSGKTLTKEIPFEMRAQ